MDGRILETCRQVQRQWLGEGAFDIQKTNRIRHPREQLPSSCYNHNTLKPSRGYIKNMNYCNYNCSNSVKESL